LKNILIFIAFSFFITSVKADLPKNDLYIPSHVKTSSTITEEDFLKAIEDMKNIYLPIFKNNYDAELVIEAKWQDGTVNAFAQQTGKVWKVSMYGGLARHKETTLDGFRAVICHEIGHHIAGAPRKPSFVGISWASNEGQSDYYATTKCLRKFLSQPEQIKETYALYRKEITDEEDLFAKNQCKLVHKTFKDRAICFRSALAGKSLARLLGSLGGNAEVFFSKKDTRKVTKTNHNHPNAQCRMDTYFQGALCINDMDELAEAEDVKKAYCTAIENFEIGIRPDCWYAASEYEK
jgi:hypothetical protein